MSWRVEVESINLDRTKTFLTDLEGATYWEIELITEPHKSWWYIRHDGWDVATMGRREWADGTEIRWLGKVREPIPPEVLSHLPEVGFTSRPLPSGMH